MYDTRIYYYDNGSTLTICNLHKTFRFWWFGTVYIMYKGGETVTVKNRYLYYVDKNQGEE